MVKETILNTLVQVAAKLIGAFVSLLVLRHVVAGLGLNEYAIFTLLGSAYLLFDVVADFGTKTIAVREMVASKNPDKTLSNLVGLRATYLVSGMMLIPLYIFMRHYYRTIEEPRMRGGHTLKALTKLRHNADLRAAFATSITFEIFVSVLAIYAAPMITSALGISIQLYLAVMLPISLISGIVLPYYIGVLADKKVGEKEFIVLGTIIMSSSALLLPFITDDNLMIGTNSIFYISIFLLIVRLGTTLCQTAVYSYFYKKVDKRDADMTALFSISWPIGLVIAPIIGAIANACSYYLNSDNYTIIFILLSLCTAYSLKYVFKMKDTK
jgi:O-antigen/teichoic acid export membrane protein